MTTPDSTICQNRQFPNNSPEFSDRSQRLSLVCNIRKMATDLSDKIGLEVTKN